MAEIEPAVLIIAGYFAISLILSVGFFVLAIRHQRYRRRFQSIVDTTEEMERIRAEVSAEIEGIEAQALEHVRRLAAEGHDARDERDALRKEVARLHDRRAMIFSEDAPTLERELRAAFERRRVNRVNMRKEFFAVRPGDVHSVLQAKFPGLPFEERAESLEFTASIEQLAEAPATIS